MSALTSRLAIPLAATIALVAGSGWWAFRPRPTLDGVAERIATGRYKAAEGRLREYLAAYPGDELGRLMLARVLVDRSDPEPEAALELLDGLQPVIPPRAAQARAIEGDAHFWAGRYDRAELAWLEALRLQPTIPEVGWKLLNVYAMQGRDEESRGLALRLFATETDEHDRVQLLLQPIRLDSHPNEAGSIVHLLEPIARANPGDTRTSTALGLALIGSGRADEGIERLRVAVSSHVDDPDARLAYLDGLVATGNLDELARALDEVPRPMANSPRFEASRGWLAFQMRDVDEAVRAYRRALDLRPPPPALASAAVAYRFRGVLRQADRSAELAELEPRLEELVKFPAVVREFYDRINERPDLGLDSHPEEYERLAEALARVGRREEADAWTLLANRRRRPPN